jgi:hypothetical protein
MITGLTLDYETADRITTLNLTDCRKTLREQLEKFNSGAYVHPDDVVYNTRLVLAMDVVLSYFGVTE